MNDMDSVWDEDPCFNHYQQQEQTAPGGSNPKQYSLHAGAQELQDLIEYRAMNFAVGNIFKAAYRLGHCDHGDELRDLRKIMWFADREIQRLSKKEVQG